MSEKDLKELAHLTAEQLIELKKAAEKEFENKIKQEVKELKKRAEFLAGQLKMTVAEMLELNKKPRVAKTTKKRKGRKGKRAKVAPKYQNPADPKQTWTGRGRQPVWVREYIENGGKLEDLLINKD